MSTWIIDDTGFQKQGDHFRSASGVSTPGLRRQGHQLSDRRQRFSVATRNEHRPDRLRVAPPQVVDRGCRTPPGGAHPGRRGVQDQARSGDRAHYHRRRRQDSGRSRAFADCFYGVSSDLRNVAYPHPWLPTSALPSTQSPGCGCSTRSAVGEAEPVGAQQLGVDLWPKGVPPQYLARGNEGVAKEAERSLLLPSRKGRESTMARKKRDKERRLGFVIAWLPGEDKLTKFDPHFAPLAHEQEAGDRAPLQGALAHRAGLRRPQGRAARGSITSSGRSFPGWHHHVSRNRPLLLRVHRQLNVCGITAHGRTPRSSLAGPRRGSELHSRRFGSSRYVLAIAQPIFARWLPRCPTCRRPRDVAHRHAQTAAPACCASCACMDQHPPVVVLAADAIPSLPIPGPGHRTYSTCSTVVPIRSAGCDAAWGGRHHLRLLAPLDRPNGLGLA